jgi:D-serine deaminase-like pyridoxal phosphate-dependent protein
MTTSLHDLETPALVLDKDRMDANIARMQDKMRGLDVALRPHVKTCKSPDVALRLSGGTQGPITVSTLKEAEQFFAAGYSDILYAVGITPNKLDHVVRLRREGCELSVILDNAEAARAVAAKATETREAIPVLVEIDCDGHRSGVKPGDPLLHEIAKTLEKGGAVLGGVMTHAGESYNCGSVEAIAAMAELERKAVVDSADILAGAGYDCTTVSVGSTPTATYARDLTGVTEVRAGVFVFFDLVMAGIAVCGIDDIALSVLVCVLGHQADRGWIITDGGWMALSRDRGTARQKVDQGYGLACDVEGRPIAGLVVSDANQEHGILSFRDGGHDVVREFPVGTLLRILPNHACATAAQHDRYCIVRRDSTAIEGEWPRFSGW